MSTTIRNEKDLFALFGVDSRVAFEKALFRNTDCGACIGWDTEVRGEARDVAFRVDVRSHLQGVAATAWRRETGPWQTMEVAPNDLVRFLILEAPGGRSWVPFPEECGRTVAEMRALPLDLQWARGTRQHPDVVCCVVPSTPVHKGITLGSIVEGSDQDCMSHDLAYPFPEEHFWDAIRTIEDEASVLWTLANREDEEDEVGA